ncbi:MAG: single-stranded-DNA-specific exonuclease RecJ [Sporomusaceae bacterium]|nr:single-stranded-DNA-specific exonuclease RecJ [Sporomusaceae bacterium]
MAETIAAKTGVSEFLAQTLVNRGVKTPQEAWEFLYADENSLLDPYLLKGMDAAVARIKSALTEKQKIAVYADYDVDGVTACVVLYRALKNLGADVTYYMPERYSEGYGLNTAALEKLIDEGIKLVITVDCGIASWAEVAAVKSRLDIIITDHHRAAEEIPAACAVIDPKQKDCPYPDKNLAGVGVAFKLCQALWQSLGEVNKLEYLDLVAVGTIADVVPLHGENRVLVKLGLKELEKTNNLGLKELIAVAGLTEKKLDTTAVSYFLAPRLNAAGRMHSAGLAIELLLAADTFNANYLAGVLQDKNTQRQTVEKNILAKAEEEIALLDLENTKILVLAGADWHLGVIGIVASRLVEKYSRPVVLIGLSDGEGRGSCRSIGTFDIYAALTKCAHLLERFGGHRQAAGFSVAPENIDALRSLLQEIVLEEMKPEAYCPAVDIDALLPLTEINAELMQELALLAPYGTGNPPPAFAALAVKVANVRAIGNSCQHLKLKVKKPKSGGSFDVVAWGLGSLAKTFTLREAIDLVFTPQYNEWQGNVSIQLKAEDLRFNVSPAAAEACAAAELSAAANQYQLLDRDIIGKIYLLLKKEFCRQDLSPKVTADLITDKLYDHSKIIINPKLVDIALTILKELELIFYKTSGDYYQIRLLPTPPTKLNLAQSPTFRLNTSRRLG